MEWNYTLDSSYVSVCVCVTVCVESDSGVVSWCVFVISESFSIIACDLREQQQHPPNSFLKKLRMRLGGSWGVGCD